MILKDFFDYIPDNKKKYFFLLSTFLIIFVFVVIKYCDAPVWSFLPKSIRKFFIKEPDSDMTLYNLGISYIVSYSFYMLVNFIPDFLNYREEAEKRINLRGAIHREIQLFTVHCMGLWESIFEVSINTGKIDPSSFASIEDVFTLQNIEIASQEIKLSNASDTMSINKQYLDWHTKIISKLREENIRGNGILSRYKSDIPTDIFYDIFYLINESSMFNFEIIDMVSSMYGKQIQLYQIIGFSSEIGRNDVDVTCQCLIELYKWVNSEHDYLSNAKSSNKITVYPIKSHSILKK